MKKKKILFGVLAIIIFFIAFIASKFYGGAISTPAGEFFYIKTGASYSSVRNELLEKKYISSPFWFDRAVQILRFKTVKPGRYKLKKGMSLFDLVRMLRAGNQAQVSFVITKIRTKETLAGRIGKNYECDSLQMIQFLNNPDSLKPFGLDTSTVMVAAMPFTYTANWNMTPGKLFRQFYTAWEQFWNKERKQKADSIGLNPIQVSILASIIDEETNKPSDRPNIASVYLNRLRKGMPLQADPTVKFAMRDFGLRRILNVHLKTESPYNTYLNKGLPPGPICTPAVETIDAILNAPQTDYLYFVANSNFDGTHIFTGTYNDHLKYARIYQQELTKLMKRRDSIQKANGQ